MESLVRRPLALALAATLATACVHAPPPPPTAGYGAPYHGTGEGIYPKDSRGDWDIAEGKHKITSEQALEATGDAEYEARRQIAKAHNELLYREGEAHRRRGNLMMKVGLGAAAAGLVLGLFVPKALQTETDTAATAMDPESRAYRSGAAANAASALCALLLVGGVGALTYGYLGGRVPPPYYAWKTPTPLNRPAYVRQMTEPYNERIGAPAMPDEADTGAAVGHHPTPAQPFLKGGRP